jgi:methionyl-tRNA synthetase
MTYLTTPIYYVNGAPHIGHAYTTVIADALARWHRARGRPTRLITGTDEHGLKVQRAATASGVAPATLAARSAAQFRATWDRLGIAYDDFVRTTADRHRAVTTELLQRVYDAGWIRRGRYEGRYCVGCEAYVAEDRCALHQRATERVSEDNWFFRLSAFESKLAEWFERYPDAVRPAARRNEALGLLRQGLKDFSISRSSITWGVPLPWDPAQVAYVWFDALGSYLTGAGWPTHEYKEWWPAHHVVGKDILRFHAIYWPAILLAAGESPPARITVHGFLLDVREPGAAETQRGLDPDRGGRDGEESDLNDQDGGRGRQSGVKISKSGSPTDDLGVLVDEFGADGLRYYLLREHPVGPDGHFSRAAVLGRYNADLANGLGNLAARTLSLVRSRHGSTAPAARRDSPLRDVADRCVDEAGRAWEDAAPSDALAAAWRLVAAANSHVVAHEPWRRPGGDPEAAYAVGDALEALRIVAILGAPAIPVASAEILRRIGAPGDGTGSATSADVAAAGVSADTRISADLAWNTERGGVRTTTGDPLFPRRPPG